MVVPALMALETVRPVGGIGGAAMTFLAPYLTFLLKEEESRRIARLLETRVGIDCLIERIEALNQNLPQSTQNIQKPQSTQGKDV